MHKLLQLQAAAGIALVRVQFNDGIQGYIDPTTIPHGAWKPFHRKTLDGAQVNSPKAALVTGSKTVVIENDGAYFGMGANEFEAMCAGGAEDLGYKVEAIGGSAGLLRKAA